MKHTKLIIASSALIITFSIVLSGCGSTSQRDNMTASSTASYDVGMAPAPAAQAPMMEAAKASEAGGGMPFSGTSTTQSALTDRKIIKHSYLSLETKAFDTALEQIFSVINTYGGYVESQSTNGQSLQNRTNYYERRASINARIPADKLEAISSDISAICNMVAHNENVEDITDSYFDSEARLKSLTLQEERLLEILSKAEKLEDVISLERALSDVRYQIESLTATIRRMDSQVTYSYLNLELREVAEYQSIEAAPKNLGEKIAASFKRSGEKITYFFEGILFFAIEDLPLVVLCLGILCVALFVVIKIVKRFKHRLLAPVMKPAERIDASAKKDSTDR